MSMLLHRVFATLLWICAFVSAFCIWAASARSGMIGAWTILPFFWSAAGLSVLVHYFAQMRAPIGRYLARHRLLAARRGGAEQLG